MHNDAEREARFESRRRRLADRVPMWTERTLDQHLAWCADRWPDDRFIVFDGEAHSYSEMAQWSRRLALTLRDQGVGRGERVGLLMGNSAEFFALTFAISQLGAVVVPLNYLLAPRELNQVLRTSRCNLIVAESALPFGHALDLLKAGLGGWSGGDQRAELPDLRGVQLTSRAQGAAGDEFELLQVTDGELHESSPSPQDPCHMFFTSGSTGVPKGVVVRHDALLREAYGTALTRAYDDGWTVLMPLPPFHIFGLLQSVLAPSFVGGAVVVERTFDAERSLALIARHRVTDLVAVPAMSQRLVDVAKGGSHDLSSLQALFTAGNAIPEAHWDDIVEVLGVDELGTGYGMTEAPGISFLVGPDDPKGMLVETVGRPKRCGVAGIDELDGQKHRFKIVDIQTRAEVSEGADGEILLGGPTVMTAYWDLPGESANAFENGFLRTGDVGHIRGDGALVLTGRVKELYRSGGENVSPKEVEAALQEHPAVKQAVVVGVPDPKWGEAGAAWVVLKSSSGTTVDELRSHCRESLARYKVPRDIHLVQETELPLTGVGKLDRLQLVKRAVALSAGSA